MAKYGWTTSLASLRTAEEQQQWQGTCKFDDGFIGNADNCARALHIEEEEDHHGRIRLQVIFAFAIRVLLQFSSQGDLPYNKMMAAHKDEGSLGDDERGKATINCQPVNKQWEARWLRISISKEEWEEKEHRQLLVLVQARTSATKGAFQEERKGNGRQVKHQNERHMVMENADESEFFGMRITNDCAVDGNDDDQLQRWRCRSQLALPRCRKGGSRSLCSIRFLPRNGSRRSMDNELC
jgi:hypothetical protein